MLFELRGIAQNLLLGFGPLRRRLHRLGSTGMNGDLAVARARLESYLRHVDVTGKDVLELGPGHTPEVLMLAREAGARRCVGLDLERHVEAEPFVTRGVELDVYGGARMPYDDRSFDVVWSSDVLEHVRRPEPTLKESFRVLRPGGLFAAAIDLRDHYFLDREDKWLRCLAYPEPLWLAMCSNRASYVNRLRASDWRELLERMGLSLEAFEEKKSDVLLALYRERKVSRFGKPLTEGDATTYRLEVAARKSIS